MGGAQVLNIITRIFKLVGTKIQTLTFGCSWVIQIPIMVSETKTQTTTNILKQFQVIKTPSIHTLQTTVYNAM